MCTIISSDGIPLFQKKREKMGWKDFGMGLGQNAISSVANNVLGMGMQAINNAIFGSPEEMMEKQHELELEKMDYQYALNQKAADYSQKQALEMWEKTNYGAQVEQMKLAGLNPGLIYGKSGGGGATTSGGGMQGVGQGSSAAVAMGLQLEQLRAQTRLTEAQTAKTNAEATKISGADTENTEADTRLKEAEKAFKEAATETEKQTQNLKAAQSEWTWADMYRVQAAAHEMWQNARKTATEADISEATKQAQIDKAQQEAINCVLAGMEAVSRIELNETQKRGIENEMKAIWAQIANGTISAEAARSQAETAAKRLAAECKKWNKELSQKDEKIMQDWIFGSIDAGCKVSSEARKWINPLAR